MSNICSAKVIADSISPSGIRITTFELEFPRIILAEFNTHRLFSRNAASTRAIPLDKQLHYLVNRHFEPSPFTVNKPGMSSNQAVIDQSSCHEEWEKVFQFSCDSVGRLRDLGVSKQHAGRLLEPFTFIKVVCTATEYDNFFWLRKHPDAQPEIQELAECMWKARQQSTPRLLHRGWWHTPYFGEGFWCEWHLDDDTTNLDDTFLLEDALAISSSCCAQVSYRKLDDTLDKARTIYQRLVESKPVHASPFEHQATPIVIPENEYSEAPKGTTHTMLNHAGRPVGQYWSANFRGWIQHRQLIDGHTCWEYIDVIS